MLGIGLERGGDEPDNSTDHSAANCDDESVQPDSTQDINESLDGAPKLAGTTPDGVVGCQVASVGLMALTGPL